MPNHSSKPKRPRDINQMAKFVVDLATGNAVEPEATPRSESAKNPHAVELGKLGGSKGGIERARRLTPEQRSDIAKKAAYLRWAKRKPKESE